MTGEGVASRKHRNVRTQTTCTQQKRKQQKVTRVKLDAIRKCEIVPFEKYELDCFSLAVNPAAASRGESDFVFSLYNRPGIQSTAKFWRAQIISAARRAGRRRALREAFTLLQDHYQSLRLEHILQDDACISAPNALDAIPESPNDQGGTEETGGIPMASEAMALVVQDPASGDESAALNQAFEEILAFPFESKEDLRWLEDTEGVSFLVSFLSQPWAMPYWPSCVGALRNVCSGSDDLKEYLVENDIIDTLLTILRTDGADKANALDLIRSLSRLPEPCRKLAEKGVINLIINVLKHPLSPSELAQGSTALQNLVTNSAENQSLLAFADHGIETVVQRFETGLDPTARLACLEILHSLSQSTSMTDLLLGKRVEDPLQRVAAGLNTKENPQMNLTLKLTLANLLANHESATTDQETAMQIVDAMSATLDGRLVGKTKYKLHSILTGVLNLVCAEKDTSALVDAGVLTLLLRTLRMTLSGECHYEETLRIKVQVQLAKILCELSFVEKNRKLLLQLGAVELFQKAFHQAQMSLADIWGNRSQAGEEDFRYVIQGALFKLGAKVADPSGAATLASHSADVDEDEDPPFTVMISYSWAQKDVVRKVAKHLKRAGIRIWLDIEQMEGSIIDCMARAVDEASAVVMCLSAEYKMSRNCRLEAEYANLQAKPIIPLMVDVNCDVAKTGWTGMLVAGKLYYDFSSMQNFVASMDSLTTTLKGLSPEQAQNTAESAASGDDSVDMTLWGCDEVGLWLVEHGLGDHCTIFADERITGKALIRMHHFLQQGRLEHVEHMLKHTLKLERWGDMLTFQTILHNALG
ncbi:hypothetical protein CYMTET_19919 [Cymbomonas tetramitiformis]|uniref:TIR domain-containing protein n=1 Tax=Cymbomonas tetramitiformis TaxID=36881 RepID=A0AAE0G6D2_9CHLO|nr:hypothetical protein CYMTET_19919 [Cymbomonas tetramitiformis]